MEDDFSFHCIVMFLINYREVGLQNGKITGPKLFALLSPPQDRVKPFEPPF